MSGNVVLGYGAGSRGEFRLSSGSLTTKGVSSKDGTGTLTFNGGTLRARNDGTLIANSANLTVTVGKKGGIIDTNDFSAFRGVCPQNLLLATSRFRTFPRARRSRMSSRDLRPT